MKCKVCNGNTELSGHQYFVKCFTCGSFSNVLENPVETNVAHYNDVYNNPEQHTARFQQDLRHWNRIFSILKPTFPHEVERLIDIAGGVGLASSVIQSIMRIPVTLIDRSVNPSNATWYSNEFDNKVVVEGAFEYLNSLESVQPKSLVMHSHFIEHLEADDAKQFLRLVKSKFAGSTLLTYAPCAGAIKDAKNAWHLNTSIPSEHRIIWSRPAMNLLLQSEGIVTTWSGDVDLDLYTIGQL